MSDLGAAIAAYYGGIIMICIAVAFGAGALTFWLVWELIAHLSLSVGWS